MTEIPVRRLNSDGLVAFKDWLQEGAPGQRPEEWLTGEKFTESLPFAVTVDPQKTFMDRYELAQYLWGRIGSVWSASLENDVGFWSWTALCYFSQLRPQELSREENYIYDPHRYLFYRHAVAMPVKLVRDFSDDARVFISSDMTVMGDMLEQSMSRQYLMRSKTFRAVVRRLYFNEADNQLKSGASSKAVRKKLAKGGWSRSGAGSVRRLALEVLRLNLAFNLEAMTPDEMLCLLGQEYSKFKA